MNKFVLLIGLATLIVFSALGIWLVEFFQEINFLSLLLKGISPWLQLIAGIIYGGFSAFVALLIINSGFFKKEKMYYSKLVSQLNLNTAGIIFISLCAGIGEEIAFRAGLQPLLGLIPTSILFVALHAYLNPFNWRISIYGIILVFIIAGMGVLFEKVGLISAMTAHALFDIILFKSLSNKKSLSL